MSAVSFRAVAGIFKCPADGSVANVPGQGTFPRVRSMTMNQHVGRFETGITPSWLISWRFFTLTTRA
jgi:hypothetical protein